MREYQPKRTYQRMKYVIGIDYGSDSARAVITEVSTGKTIATATKNYPRWSKGLYCNPSENRYRQHPLDYIEALECIIREAVADAPEGTAENIVGISFDTTGSTPCLVDETGTPLAMKEGFAENPNAMFILWKDHTAIKEADDINKTAHSGQFTDYTQYEGGIYSCEWFWSKALHVLREDKEVRDAAYSIVEHCDWMPALLTGVTHAKDIVRSRCAAGHKAMWDERWGGLPSEEFLTAVDPLLTGYRARLYDKTETSDKAAGKLTEEWAERLGLPAGIAVGVSELDCHMGAVGAGITKDTLVRIIGTSTCDIIVTDPSNLPTEAVRGICGQVDGSVIPGLVGLEAGQSAFGDIYAWFRRILEWPLKNVLHLEGEELEKAAASIIPELTAQAEAIDPECSSVLATDWMNGRRTPDANPLVKGTVTGITLGTSAPMIYRALVEATAYGTRAILERFRNEGVNIDKIIGIGGISLKSPFVMQTMCNALNTPIKVCRTEQACALGAAMFAAVAAGEFECIEDAQKAMSSGFATEYQPQPDMVGIYDRLYDNYIKLGEFTETHLS